ncbi:50S ribosomal protein L29 [Patescibacteria group bacterium]|nr:50S ribosomal protein L29 [Patescibacteria group bacterium]
MSVTQLPFKDIAEKSLKELVLLRRTLKKELFDARMKNALKSLKETHTITVLRKNIAKINTALSSKSIIQ